MRRFPRLGNIMAEPAQSGTPSGSSFSFVQMEHDILRFWEDAEIFQKTLAKTSDKKPYIFYDGPPFATGLPHHGHLVASTIKDIVPRYWTMKGRYVQRRFGWDCHGLPIEHEIDKQLGMPAQQAVEDMRRRPATTPQCRSIVQRYVAEWHQTITRIGRWVDFDNDYKTMDPDFMESVWWVFKQLWDKGLIYRGRAHHARVHRAGDSPCRTSKPTSNYKDVQDPAVTVLFELVDEDAYLAAWTTTPWTLPSNLAVCVNPDLDYVKVRDSGAGRHIYLAEERVAAYGRLRTMEKRSAKAGSSGGRRYEPLFPYFADQAEPRARSAWWPTTT